MPRRRKDKSGTLPLVMAEALPSPLGVEARSRYLSYALSVITARALPDVRDGLKPVQRRILYTMFNELKLRYDGRPRKSAAVVGEVMGKFHPHGDTAIYDALVRLAQDFAMRVTLVDGRGNFGSPDGDGAAAMRYTEARLSAAADELMRELSQDTVDYRANYDGTREEPVVLPARFPNLLVNGSQGIAVGMATSIPPHAPHEVLNACIALIDDPEADTAKLLKHVKGPDFPTGGELVAPKASLLSVYEKGHGSLALRGTWRVEEASKRERLFVITSLPYAIERGTVVERIAALIVNRKLPLLTDVRDESTDICRVVCEMRPDADAEQVAAYLFKHTPLATNVQVNLTCLVPQADSEVLAPRRLNLAAVLRHFLDFRMEVTTRRLTHDLEVLLARIHVLEGFEIIFASLDEVLRIIRKSDGRRDASERLCKRFSLSEKQVDAILDLRLYRLAKLEVLEIERELEDKRGRAEVLRALLADEGARWSLLREELEGVRASLPTKRQTRVTASAATAELDAEALIIDEPAVVVLTEQGWLKRQQRIKDIHSTRVREGDRVAALLEGSTRRLVTLFSNFGAAYTTFIAEIQATTGYGNPVQSLFKLKDGERIIALALTDGDAPETLAFATASGLGAQLPTRLFGEPSTRAGRRYARLAGEDTVVDVTPVSSSGDSLLVLSQGGKVLRFPLAELSVLGGPGKGVTLLKLDAADALVAARSVGPKPDPVVLILESGKELRLRPASVEMVKRGGRGNALFRRGRLERLQLEAPNPQQP